MKIAVRCFAAITIWMLIPAASYAQSKQGKLPSFRIALADSSYFGASKLNKAPVLFVYFKPDCGHCKEFTEKLINRRKSFGKTQIVMITDASLGELQNFDKKYNLTGSHIIVGTEGYTLAFLRQLNIQSFPFAALYDKSGHLQKRYDFPDIDALIKDVAK